MHEMSIAINIVDIAVEEANKAGADLISEIVLDIGSLSGVEIEALKFAMDSAVKSSPVLDKSKLLINEIQAKARCRQCQNEFDVESVFSLCEKCQSYDMEILQGNEMKIRSLVIDD